MDENSYQWLFLVPLKGGRWHSPSPNWQYIPLIYHLYTTYILPSGGLYNPYHLLGEPETAIDPIITTCHYNWGDEPKVYVGAISHLELGTSAT